MIKIEVFLLNRISGVPASTSSTVRINNTNEDIALRFRKFWERMLVSTMLPSPLHCGSFNRAESRASP